MNHRFSRQNIIYAAHVLTYASTNSYIHVSKGCIAIHGSLVNRSPYDVYIIYQISKQSDAYSILYTETYYLSILSISPNLDRFKGSIILST